MKGREEVKEIPKIRVSGETRANELHPARNEDFFIQDNKRLLFGVFDGVGGGATPKEASRTAGEVIQREIAKNFSKISQDTALGVLKRAFKKAHEELMKINTERVILTQTTASVGLLWPPKNPQSFFFINMGDSRIYLFRGGELAQVTCDDSLTSEYVNEGKLTEDQADQIDQASEFESLSSVPYGELLFGQRHIITQALGWGDIVLNFGDFKVEKRDLLLFATDGIFDNLQRSEMEEVIKATPTNRVAQSLVNYARERSREGKFRSKCDDMTVLIVELS